MDGNKIPTAKELILNDLLEGKDFKIIAEHKEGWTVNIEIEEIIDIIKKYSDMHVRKALYLASQKAYCSLEHPDDDNDLEESDYIVDKHSILNAYPTDLIL